VCVLSFALAKAGKSMPARIAIIAITTKSSIKVNPRNNLLLRPLVEEVLFMKFLGIFEYYKIG
jgi:hypothetical protein